MTLFVVFSVGGCIAVIPFVAVWLGGWIAIILLFYLWFFYKKKEKEKSGMSDTEVKMPLKSGLDMKVKSDEVWPFVKHDALIAPILFIWPLFCESRLILISAEYCTTI